MALTYVERVGDGSTTVFSFSFVGVDNGYFREEDIEVKVDGVLTAFTLQTETTLEITPAPALNATIVIRRIMPYEVPYSTFTRGNNFGQDNMNYSFQQGLYLVHEILDGYLPEGFSFKQNLDMGGYRIYNLGAPTFPTDAVRLIDLQGGEQLPRGVKFNVGDSYMLLDTPLPLPVGVSAIAVLEMRCKFQASSNYRQLVGEGAAATTNFSAGLNANLTEFVVKDGIGTEYTTDATALAIPVEEEITVQIETQFNGSVYKQRFSYNGLSTNWIDAGVLGNWQKIFGSGVVGSSSLMTIYAMSYDTDTIFTNWDFFNQSGTLVTSLLAAYNGQLIGDDWEAVDPDTGIALTTYAEDVIFNPFGTNFNPASVDVDAVLREIDTTFVRYATVDPDPDPVDGTPLVPYRIWLADSELAPRSRPLPNPAFEGAEVTVRDDAGFAGTNKITIGRNGKTIMGLAEDMDIDVDWSWVKLRYFEILDDWRVIEGGVGAQVVQTISTELQQIYQVGHIHLTTNALNPVAYFGFGTWTRRAEGLFLAGIGTGTDSNGLIRDFLPRDNAGEYAHTQTEAELAPHTHSYTRANDSTNTGGVGGSTVQDQNKVADTTGSTGGGTAMNVTTPSFAIYVWERTA
jgi:hypothetical protein